MAFIQPCFIRKNTPELRQKLEELGYESCHQMTIHPNVYRNIAVCNFLVVGIMAYLTMKQLVPVISKMLLKIEE